MRMLLLCKFKQTCNLTADFNSQWNVINFISLYLVILGSTLIYDILLKHLTSSA